MAFFLVLISLYSKPVFIFGAYVFIFGAYVFICGAFVFIFGAFVFIFGALVFIFGAFLTSCHCIRSFQLYMRCSERVIFTEPRSHEGGGLGTIVGHLDSCTRIVSKHGINFE